MSKKVTTVKCPHCNKAVEWSEQSPFRPFCSKKCQMIDFGTWANEEKAIPGAPDMSDADGWSEDHTSV
ncbi:DNA gyrase inhibitor YacG [Vibrio quintilis]|uniref:DNA gyrase inhibitor YacG n=1 Tax=Vibrio quintilis TaxID=1117707 RepID=A0A1M7YTW8_9VIBR|nr:DNA gyrase inhibitor YacG [Vibrio quintilis]SHO56097.1 DNA gyrase inhibitor YacG [Vibrio quintilis]